jgi:Fe2+ or Zn2+ uptake regulation protein
VIEFVDQDLSEIEKRLGTKYDFDILEHRLDVTGYCSECKQRAVAAGDHS